MNFEDFDFRELLQKLQDFQKPEFLKKLSLGKLILMGLGTSLALIFLAALLFIWLGLDSWLKSKIEVAGQDATGGTLKISELHSSLFPPTLSIAGLHFSTGTTEAGSIVSSDVKSIKIQTNKNLFQLLNLDPGRIIVDVEDPKITIKDVKSDAKVSLPSNAKQKSQSSLATTSPKIAIEIHIKNGSINSKVGQGKEQTAVSTSPLTVDIVSEDLGSQTANVSLNANAHIENGSAQTSFPIKGQFQLGLKDDSLSLSEAQGELAGLQFELQASSNLKSGEIKATLNAQIEEIAKLAVPPSFLPPGQWSGQVDTQATIYRPTSFDGWTANGHLNVFGLHGQAKVNENGLALDGPVAASAAIGFQIKPLPHAPSTPIAYDIRSDRLSIALDASQARIEKKDLFSKPSGVPLKLNLTGSGTLDLASIESFEFDFAQFQVLASGQLALKPGFKSQLKFNIPHFNVAGFDQFLDPLKGFPAKGAIELSGAVVGDLFDPTQLGLTLRPLQLEKIQASVHWKDDKLKRTIEGQLSVDGAVTAESEGTRIKTAFTRLDVDLSQLQIEWPDLLTKKQGIPLFISMNLVQMAEAIDIKRLDVALGRSRIGVTGRVIEPLKPRLFLKLNSNSVLPSELLGFFPKASDVPRIDSELGFNLQLDGAYDMATGPMNSPLQLQGDARLVVNKYTIEKKPVTETKTTAENTQTKTPQAALLPAWPIARSANIRFDTTVKELKYGETPITGIHTSGRLDHGALQARSDIQNIFAGSLSISNIETQLSSIEPDVGFDINPRGVQLDLVTQFMSPEWKGLIQGLATGNVHVKTVYPMRNDVIEKLNASGELTVKNGYLSTASLDHLVNDSLAKIPGLNPNSSHVNSQGAAADMTTRFQISKSVVRFDSLSVLTPDKNELHLQGTVGLDKNIDLKGNAYLVTAPVGGSIREANSDNQGRFMVPIHISGNLMKPEATIAEATVQELLKRTADHELKKSTSQATQKIKNETDKLKEELKKKGLDGLNELFK